MLKVLKTFLCRGICRLSFSTREVKRQTNITICLAKDLCDREETTFPDNPVVAVPFAGRNPNQMQREQNFCYRK